jgi:hypothetical protein
VTRDQTIIDELVREVLGQGPAVVRGVYSQLAAELSKRHPEGPPELRDCDTIRRALERHPEGLTVGRLGRLTGITGRRLVDQLEVLRLLHDIELEPATPAGPGRRTTRVILHRHRSDHPPI